MPLAIALGADGSTFYVVGASNSLSVWERNTRTGHLTFVERFSDRDSDCDKLDYPIEIAVSKKSGDVWIVGKNSHAVVQLQPKNRRGMLKVVQSVQGSKGKIDGLALPVSAAVTSDGMFLYVGSSGSTVSAFNFLPPPKLSDILPKGTNP